MDDKFRNEATEDWKCTVAAMELSIPDPRYPDITLIYDYWNAQRGDRFAPARRDIDPVDMASALPRITLVNVEYEPLDFKFRLAGTGICKVHGTEPTGWRPSDLPPVDFGRMLHRHYAACVKEKRPFLHALMLDSPERSGTYVRLLMPLSEDGENVTMLMTVDSAEQNSDALKQFFAEARRRSAPKGATALKAVEALRSSLSAMTGWWPEASKRPRPARLPR